MTGNIVGEEFDDYVFSQISQRQKNQFSGYNSTRTPDQLQYLNNTNAWVKLASGASINKADEGLERLRKILKSDDVDKYNGDELAKKAILFNGLSEVDPATYKDDKKIEKLSEYNSRAGYSKSTDVWNLTSAYGLGGSEFGQQPMPGIQSVSVKSLNRGSIREANIKLKAYNKSQFEIIELLYLRVGFTMMLEWGNDKFIDNKGELKKTGNTIIEDLWFTANGYTQMSMIEAIERYRGYYDGNYDGFFGKVVNFTWTFGSDGSYDIDLKLITVGDIIESLQANIPVNSAEVGLIDTDLSSSIEDGGAYINLADSSIVNAAQSNKIGKYLFTSISDDKLWESNPDYFSLKANQLEKSNKRGRTTSDFPLDRKINDKYNYFMSFGELLNIFQNNLIPGIEIGGKIDSCLDIENDPYANRISYYPNQTSLDPRICIFKYVFGSLGESNKRFSISGVATPPYLYELNNYVDVIGSNVLYGKLMNIYLNYDFISKCLTANTKDGKLTVFKFFQKICDGINEALGGVNNIEPIIKKDKIVTFIDQNPIPGLLETLSVDKTIVDLEVYGYNEASGSSNFVQDISFKTQISPNLASMITIGTTAGGANEDGTAFSYWNEGLIDRFAPKYVEAEGDINKSTSPEKDRILELIKIYDKDSAWRIFGPSDDPVTSFFEGINPSEKSKYKGERRQIKYSNINAMISCREFVDKQLKEDKYLKNNKGVISQGQLAAEKLNNYAVYLSEAFGGTSGVIVRSLVKIKKKNTLVEKTISPIPIKNSKYTLFDPKFIQRAKSTYKVYINSIMKADFFQEGDDKTPSNQIGFIPVGFDIKLQGIAGIKIYNKLNINNTFLPSQYPKALKFVINGVNHNISNNKWETNLSTISIPRVQNTNTGDISSFLAKLKVNASNIIQEDILPLEEQKPLPPVDTKVTRIYYKGEEISILNTLKLMNEDAKSAFRPFLAEFVNDWDGYKMKINAVGRTYEKSVYLKSLDKRNAAPGYSKHNYYSGLDFNIVTPLGEMLRKKGMRSKWINQGFQKLANKHDIEWGGDFAKYEDCIHFSVKFNINTAVKNAIAKYGSLDKLTGDKGKTVKII
jgi:hypothetical protein